MIVTYKLSTRSEPEPRIEWFRCGTPALNRALARAQSIPYSDSLKFSYVDLRARLSAIAASRTSVTSEGPG